MEEDRMPKRGLQNKEKGGRPRTRGMEQAQKDMEAKGVDWRHMAEEEDVSDDPQRRKLRMMMMMMIWTCPYCWLYYKIYKQTPKYLPPSRAIIFLSLNKAFGVGGETEKPKIFQNRPQKSEFVIKAKEVLGQITRLRDFIFEHRKAYLNFASHLSDVPQMSDIERDKIDSGAQRIINTCSHLIQDFKKESDCFVGSPQLKEHHQAVLELVESYLKAVCKLYSEQRAIRVKRALEVQKMAKLELDVNIPNLETTLLKRNKTLLNENKENQVPAKDSNDSTPRKLTHSNGEDASQFLLEDEQLSAEEIQMFESENANLYNELNSLTEEVKQIESKVVRIAELQEIFTEKVLQQEVDIDRIANTVVGATENVKDANEQIRQAIQRNADNINININTSLWWGRFNQMPPSSSILLK
ncbi:unnamed protein product [Timema podura]|uniref:Syntaxin-18 n=1 Tax=Timema podura TaxID=61482 RepID=A0ABN7P6R8_TIMPD|nr:unnamed protein product [Timema podura]